MIKFQLSPMSTTLTVAVVLSAALANSPKAIAEQPKEVIIANPLPLPVTGSTTVTGTAAVRVTNTDATPVPVKLVDRPQPGRPFQTTLCLPVGLGLPAPTCGSDPHEFDVPSDRRLVIEYVSGECSGSNFDLARPIIQTKLDGTFRTHVFHLVPDAFRGKNILDVNQQTRIYADPGTKVNMAGEFGGPAAPGSLRCTLTLSGQTYAQ